MPHSTEMVARPLVFHRLLLGQEAPEVASQQKDDIPPFQQSIHFVGPHLGIKIHCRSKIHEEREKVTFPGRTQFSGMAMNADTACSKGEEEPTQRERGDREVI